MVVELLANGNLNCVICDNFYLHYLGGGLAKRLKGGTD